MKHRKCAIDYREFRWSKLNSKEFRHLKLLLYWPIFGLLFLFVEHINEAADCDPVHCFLDDKIPFSEIFVIPYLFWFIYIIGMLLYTLLYDVDAFRKMMRFIMITYTAAILIYLIFPTRQDLRPSEFAQDNFLTQLVNSIYGFDTNTNVCPSIHVMGSLAVMFTALHCKGLQKRIWKWFFVVVAVLICMSTVFLKQHSVIDVIAALPICLAAYDICFRQKEERK